MSDQSGESKLLTPELRVKLERIAREEGFVNPLFRLGEGSKAGDGFIGVVSRVCIEEQDDNNRTKSPLPLVIKCLPSTSPADHIFSIDTFFRMETIFYDVIQPAFNKFQTERGIKQLTPISPHCYDATNDIILEDMRPLGYTMKKGNYMIDLPHCVDFLKELGRLHAVSFAMKEQEPEIYKNITKDLEEPFIINNPSKIMKERFDKAVVMAKEEFKKRVTLPDKERYVDILERFLDENYYKKLTDLIEGWRAEPYAVVNHGDCWSNNALFKYENEDKSVPSAICLLDFQVVRNTSPVLDIAYLIFIGTTKAMRDKHYKELLRTYYDSLSVFMRKLGSDPEKLFPYSALEDQLKRFAKLSLGLAVHETPVFTYNAADEPPADDNASATLDPAFSLTHANSDSCWSHVCDVIVDMVDLGYVE